jgi:putative tryptophan/tyrosine transport system substrate-binding protein
MRRRDFISLLGGATVAWPLAARAQQPERMRRIGVLDSAAADDPDNQARHAAFVQGLQSLGWTVGRNVQIDHRWVAGNAADARKYAAELVALAPDVLLATGSAALGSLLDATRTVPIVFAIVPDPVGAGYVDSLSRPGGNATGFMMFEYSLCGKWLELLKEIAPGVTRAAILRDTSIAAGIGQFAIIQSVAPSVGVDVTPIDLRDPAEIERAVTLRPSPSWCDQAVVDVDPVAAPPPTTPAAPAPPRARARCANMLTPRIREPTCRRASSHPRCPYTSLSFLN